MENCCNYTFFLLLMMLLSSSDIINAISIKDVCSNSTGNITVTHEKFTNKNCATKNFVMVMQLLEVENYCKGNKKPWIRIAGQNICGLKRGTCVIVQRGWKICDNIRYGFKDCDNMIWIFNKTSLPKIKFKRQENTTSDITLLTYHHLKCNNTEDLCQPTENLDEKEETENDDKASLVLGILFGLSIIVIVILIFVLFNGKIKEMILRQEQSEIPQETFAVEGACSMTHVPPKTGPAYAMAEEITYRTVVSRAPNSNAQEKDFVQEAYSSEEES